MASKEPAKGVDGIGCELEQAKEKVEEYTGLLQRLQADFENYRKRVERESEQRRLYANQEIVHEFLDVKDNLERALENEGDPAAVREGVQLTLKQLDGLLAKHGVTEIDCEGEKFDPEHHEALFSEEGDVDEEVVSEVLQKGYMLHSRTVRPAKVKIVKPREDE